MENVDEDGEETLECEEPPRLKDASTVRTVAMAAAEEAALLQECVERMRV